MATDYDTQAREILDMAGLLKGDELDEELIQSHAAFLRAAASLVDRATKSAITQLAESMAAEDEWPETITAA